MGLTKITSRILDSSGVTILGTIATGVWQGTAINQTYLVGQSGTNTGDETLARINALDVTELGTISSGVWNGTAINQTYLVGQSGTNTGDETLARINALDVTELGTISSGVWQGSVIAEAYLQNQSGTNTGDQTTISGNAGTVTNGVYTTGNQTIAGVKTFSGAVNVTSADDTRLKLTDTGNSSELIFRSDGANTQIYTNTAHDLGIYTANNVGQIHLKQSTGNVGIGTASPYEKLTIDGGNIILGGASDNYSSTRGIYFRSNFSPNGSYSGVTNATRNISIVANVNKLELNSYEGIDFYTSYTPRMSILTNGNILIGTTNADVGGSVQGIRLGNDGRAIFAIDTGSLPHYISPVGADRRNNSGDGNMFSMWRQGVFKGAMGITGNDIVFKTGNNSSDSEKMRITSAGNQQVYANTANDWVTEMYNDTTNTPYGIYVKYRNVTPNSTASAFLRFDDASQNRFQVYSNGNVANFSNSYGSLSDVKLKENILDATPKLNDLLTVKIRNYNLIGDDNKQIGVIAQELEEIFPSMVEESKDTEDREVTDEEGNVTTEIVDLGTTTKSVKYSVFTPMLIKAIQEQQAQIELLKQEVELLKQ